MHADHPLKWPTLARRSTILCSMLERFFLKPQTVDRILGCWLGSRIEAYVTALCDQGYSTRTILRRVPIS